MEKAIQEIAIALVQKGKGILAADESDKTIEKRFSDISLPSTEENRRNYRELLFTTNQIEQYISGVILFDETIRQKSTMGTSFCELLSQKGIIPGIKVDKGTSEFNSQGEKVTDGLDGLSERLEEYKLLGARFAKWRAVIAIGEGIPTLECIEENAERLGKYASICQNAQVLPIVEPEVLMDGVHTIEKCREVTYKTLKLVFSKLSKYNVDFSAVLLKPNMIISGKNSGEAIESIKIAELTTKVFSECLPDELPGVVFLSGGQSPEEATANLNEINKFGQMKWPMSFSFGRALQEPVLKTWAGKSENLLIAQKQFLKRARLNSLATQGLYETSLESGND